MRTGLTKQEKTTEIYFDEKTPIIFIRTHNTDLKPPHTERNAAGRQAKRRKSAAFIERLHICMETVIEKFVLCMV
mgnify:CR=1 FL=1